MKIKAGMIVVNVRVGGVYKVLGFAIHSETKETLVIHEGELGVIAMPIQSFSDKFAEIKEYDGDLSNLRQQDAQGSVGNVPTLSDDKEKTS